MICASEVLPRPGGPASSTWSSASPRPFAASSAIRELLLDALLADELGERARPERALELLLAAVDDGRGQPSARVMPPA